MDILVTLGRTLGFSLAAGVNLYATVALVGLAARYGWVALPAQFQVFDNPWIIGGAAVLYTVEFFADKIPWVDTIWDAVHTFVRPVGGALIAVAALGEASPTVEGLVALLGGAVAAGSHATKASTRVAANASPEPFSNWALSLIEDVFVVALGVITLKYPLIALGASAAILLAMILAVRWIWRWLRRPAFAR
ncbi:MAG: DUF4126 domain-containing protein [Acidobacteria bacterium]|nr:DUF4126 domain-containing protein [Acidobacteriota bacterium]